MDLVSQLAGATDKGAHPDLDAREKRAPRAKRASPVRVTAIDPDEDWRSFYRAADAPVSLIERFAAFRALRPYRQVERDGLEVRYRANGEGAPLLYLPDRLGLGDAAWRLIELAERNFRVIALDYGPASTAEELVRCAVAALEAEGVLGAVLVGSGVGGLVAQRLADRLPQAVLGMALLNAPAPSFRLTPARAARASFLRRLPRRWALGLERRRADRLLSCPREEERFWCGYHDEAFRARRSVEDFTNILKAEADLHAIGGDSPSGFHKPVLIVETEKDDSAPQTAIRRLPARFPRAERRFFSYGAGHTVEITRHREIAHALDKLRRAI